MAHLKNHQTAYAKKIDGALFDAIPKAVFAAIAISPALNGGAVAYANNGAACYVVTEWHIQHVQGLIPQPVPRKWRHLIHGDAK